MDELMESKIVRYAMRKVGTQRVSALNGTTLEYENNWYTVHVDGNEVTVEESMGWEVDQMEKKIYKVFYRTGNGNENFTYIEAAGETTIKEILRSVQGMQTELIRYVEVR